MTISHFGYCLPGSGHHLPAQTNATTSYQLPLLLFCYSLFFHMISKAILLKTEIRFMIPLKNSSVALYLTWNKIHISQHHVKVSKRPCAQRLCCHLQHTSFPAGVAGLDIMNLPFLLPSTYVMLCFLNSPKLWVTKLPGAFYLKQDPASRCILFCFIFSFWTKQTGST